MNVPKRVASIGLIAAVVAGLLLLGWHFAGLSGPSRNEPALSSENHPAANATPGANPGPARESGFHVDVTGARPGENCHVVALAPTGRITPVVAGGNRFRFPARPAPGSELLAWAAGPTGDDAVTSVSDWTAVSADASAQTLALRPVWTVTVALSGVEEGVPPPALGIRFGSTAQADSWVRRLQFLSGRAVRDFLREPVGPHLFRLPLLPSAADLQISATAGRLYAESAELRLDKDAGITLALVALPGTRSVRVRDSFGAPMVVDLSVVEEAGESSRPDSRRHQVVTTGMDGAADIPTWENSTLLIKVMSEQWVSTGGSFAMPPDQAVLDIEVWRTVTLRLRAQYQDGQPFYGSFHVTGTFPGGTPAGFGGRFVGESETLPAPAEGDDKPRLFRDVAELRGLPQGVAMQVVLEQVRVGYPLYRHEIPPYEVTDGREFLLVIPRGSGSSQRSRVRISGATPPPVDQVVQVFRLSQGMTILASEFRLAEAQDSGLLAPGAYLVRVAGTVCWQSPEFELVAGITKDIVPDWQQPATIQVRVLDADGRPLAGAVLDIANAGAPSFKNNGQTSTQAFTNDQGQAELTRQPPGRATFRLEAAGFQPELRVADVSPGQVLHLGDVRLSRAVERLVVRLPAGDYSNLDVSIRVSSTFSQVLCAQAAASGSVVTVEGLAVGRTYAVSVYCHPAGTQKQFNTIRLSGDEPSVTLDATDLALK